MMLTAIRHATLYFARKRRRAREEATADGGGMRAQQFPIGLLFFVVLG